MTKLQDLLKSLQTYFMHHPADFTKYRSILGFGDQNKVKAFFGAKDIKPTIDLNYLKLLNARLEEIVRKIDEVAWEQIKVDNLDSFVEEHVYSAFEIIYKNAVIPRLNNLGRRPEQVYFSWMRGFVVTNYFYKALSYVFETDVKNISLIGNDDLGKIETFRKTPTADLELVVNGKQIRIEMQSGFTGINDIKQHKVLEAKRTFSEKGIPTIAVHLDLFNGQAAFVRLDNVEDNSLNWITRQQMEGQTVFNVDPNYFCWLLQEQPPKFKDLKIL